MAKEEKIRLKLATLPTLTERGFQPILEVFCSILHKYDLQPIDTLEKKSIKPLSEGVEKPFLKGFFKPFKMEKCEKICLSHCMLMDSILVSALIIIPDDDYELPLLLLEWSETGSAISILVDFLPMVDLVMREDYREKYLDPMNQYWTKYKSLPGMEPNRFAWARQMFSPYYLSGSISKESEKNKEDCIEIINNYLELWISLWQKAEPIKDGNAKEYIRERKTNIRKIFRANDEGAKTMAQMVGQEIIDLLLLCNF
ncbi:MAG: hypothetical protein AMJ42_02020 [Deltaproteobacteria bacterium DG_8]|nr:MAG: hypothetical protein AMJ42_02020 [Deltaproteobacteria bacterium DG_8]